MNTSHPRRRALLAGTLLAAGTAALPRAWAQALPTARGQGRLVVVFLRGALDGLSAFVPWSDPDYARLRPGIAIPPPDGYKTDAATWLSPDALTRRADLALALGRGTADLGWLQPFLSPATRARIAAQPAQLQAGLMLASPDFMNK